MVYRRASGYASSCSCGGPDGRHHCNISYHCGASCPRGGAELIGDAEAPAKRTAEALGIGYGAGLLPEDKVGAVRELVEKHGDVGMVGDGVNDAPALAASSVGFG